MSNDLPSRPDQHILTSNVSSYAWDESFSIEGFARAIDGFNEKEASNVQENLGWISESPLEDKPISAARTTYGSTVSEVLSPKKDILIPILIPDDFLEFANEMTVQALRQALNLDQSVDLEPLRPAKTDPQDDEGEGGEKLVIWRLDKVLSWQMLDRRIDEFVYFLLLNALILLLTISSFIPGSEKHFGPSIALMREWWSKEISA